jgi:serine protease Do
MRSPLPHTAVAVVLLLSSLPTIARAQYDRETAIVQAVDKTSAGILTLKVVKTTREGIKDVVGTGVVVDERGYAVTNYHVVRDATSITATLSDDTTVKCEVLVEDSRQDLAILKLPVKKKLHALRFAPGSDLKRGEIVIALGNPFGYDQTVTTGIISALKRKIIMPNGAELTNLIQHSAAINPGNSGGALLNINGELIGINVALRQEAQGIAFALNADTVQTWLATKLSAKKMAGLNHGLACHEQVAAAVGTIRQKVVVDTVAASSPGATAGVQAGDVIVVVNDQNVTNRFDLERALWNLKPGQKIEAAILREGKKTTVTLNRAEPARVTAVAGTR